MNFEFKSIFPLYAWRKDVNSQSIRQDFFAGLTGGIIALPQGVAYALIAGLPPEFGLYSAIVICIVASLFGSSKHMVSGPTAALSIVVLSVVGNFVNDQSDYINSVLLFTLIVGVIQLLLGFFKFGSLINFISHTVVVGFTAGASILIATSQLKHLFGVDLDGGLSFFGTIVSLLGFFDYFNYFSLFIGVVTFFTSFFVRKVSSKLPHLLIGLFVGSLLCYLLDGVHHGVLLVGELPVGIPEFSLPVIQLDTVAKLIPGALAIALLGLIEAVSIARSISLRSHQRIDSNQEFIGQGLSNVVGSMFSCFVGSGSFTRSGANYDSGAKTPIAAIFSALFIGFIIVWFPTVTTYLPMPAMAGSILLICLNLISFHHILDLFKSSKSESLILVVTFLSTLFVALEFAIYVGVIVSLVVYLRKTSRPTVIDVAPIQTGFDRRIRNVNRYNLEQCPQIKIIRVDGSIFFGAVDHIQSIIHNISDNSFCHIVMVGKGINFIDMSGSEMLIQEAIRLNKTGRKLVLCSLKGTVLDELCSLGFLDRFGRDNIYDTPKLALSDLIAKVDEDICMLCDKRIFEECSTKARLDCHKPF
jgi:SulP family sulfate permease